MGPVTSIAAGFAAALGAMALYRALERRARSVRNRVHDMRSPKGKGVIDLELDAASGVYRAK
ncbi:MAG: hypothetical protein ABL957_07385 [Parvularculaceae bacterium]